MRSLVTLVAIAGSAAIMLLAAAPAAAGPEKRTEAVSHADLDLSTLAGQAKLNRRIAGAANRVCGVENTRELTRWAAERRCIAEALAGPKTVTAQLIADRQAKQIAGGASVAARR